LVIFWYAGGNHLVTHINTKDLFIKSFTLIYVSVINRFYIQELSAVQTQDFHQIDKCNTTSLPGKRAARRAPRGLQIPGNFSPGL